MGRILHLVFHLPLIPAIPANTSLVDSLKMIPVLVELAYKRGFLDGFLLGAIVVLIFAVRRRS